MPVLYEVDDPVATITIARPATRTALDIYHLRALAAAWRRFKGDSEIWLAITTVRLPRQLNFPAAMEFLLTAERFPAERALELGLINEIVNRDQLMARAREWADRITVNAPLAVRATKESVLRGLSLDLEEAYKLEQEISSKVFQTEDAKEGPKAFAEKRPPV